MKTQIRITDENAAWASSVLEFIKKKNNPVHRNTSIASLCNLAIQFGQSAVESMFDYTTPKKKK